MIATDSRALGEHAGDNGMDRFWLKNYPPGVPADIDVRLYPSLNAVLDESFGRYRQRSAYVCMDRKLTFGQLDEMSRDFAAWLQAQGFGRGTRVAVMLPNVLQFPVVVAGILRAGCIVANVNPLYTPRELEHQLKDCGAEAIVILENFAGTLQQVVERTAVSRVVLASLGELLGPVKGRVVDFVVRHLRRMVPEFELSGVTRFNDVIAAGRSLPWRPVQLGHDDVAFLQYTGGTTGLSKGAVLTHRNAIAALLQSEAWFQPALAKQAADEQAVTVCALPLYHIFALSSCFLLSMRLGGLNILIPNPRDIPGTVRELSKHRFTSFPAVNTLFNALAHDPDFAKLDFSRLGLSIGGGMAIQRTVSDAWKRVTGIPVCEGYGLSETAAIATCNPVTAEGFSGTIGLPLPSVEISIRDDDGREVPLGERGEICIRGPQVMPGYWEQPRETEKVMTADGFFKSGDIGVMEESGYTRIVDRKKDMILVSGFNVYPNEVEEVVVACPGVLECAAIGVSDPHSGEAVKVFVVRKDPGLTERDVMEWCTRHLTGYKKPKSIEFRSELPKSNVGKILRRELRGDSLRKAA
jgi:long-chain acyl-CoA synthetase